MACTANNLISIKSSGFELSTVEEFIDSFPFLSYYKLEAFALL